MSREFWWIRHGESEWNAQGRFQGHSDPGLSEKGKAQARALAARLAHVQFDAVFCSDLTRARQTADLAMPGGSLTLDGRLREIHFGVFEGHRLEDLTVELKEHWHAWWRDPFGLRVPQGESMADMAERVAAWQSELPEQGRFAVFTHGGLIRCALWTVTGPPPGGAWTVSLDNTSITRIKLGAERNTIYCMNDCAHLESLPC